MHHPPPRLRYSPSFYPLRPRPRHRTDRRLAPHPPVLHSSGRTHPRHPPARSNPRSILHRRLSPRITKSTARRHSHSCSFRSRLLFRDFPRGLALHPPISTHLLSRHWPDSRLHLPPHHHSAWTPQLSTSPSRTDRFSTQRLLPPLGHRRH